MRQSPLRPTKLPVNAGNSTTGRVSNLARGCWRGDRDFFGASGGRFKSQVALQLWSAAALAIGPRGVRAPAGHGPPAGELEAPGGRGAAAGILPRGEGYVTSYHGVGSSNRLICLCISAALSSVSALCPRSGRGLTRSVMPIYHSTGTPNPSIPHYPGISLV